MKRILFALVLFLLSGCATSNSEGPFNDVKDLIRERTGQKIAWKKGASEDLEVRNQISKILSSTISLEDALKVSLLNNPTLQAEFEQLGVNQAELVQAGILQNPTLSLERRFKGDAMEIDIAQNFLDLFLIPLRTKLARAELEATKRRIAQLVLSHVGEVKSVFYSLQAESQLLEMREVVVEALQSSYDVARAMKKAGNLSALEVQNEANLLAHAKVELSEASMRVTEERERLNILLGAWGPNTYWKIEKRLPDLPSEEISLQGLETYAINHRFDLEAAKQELESLAAQVGISRYEAIIPDLSVTGHFEREPEGDSSRGPSFVLPLPLFNWGEAAAQRSNGLLRQSLRSYEALAIEIRSKVRLAYSRMEACRLRAKYIFKEVLPLQREITDQTQLFYNGMFIGATQLIQAKQAQILAGQSYIETLKSFWLSRTELEQAVGGNLNLASRTKSSLSATIVPQAETKPTLEEHHHRHGVD